MRWLVRGDIDGFFGLALDNLVQILLIVGLCGGLLGFPSDLIFGRILPGVAVSLLVGNLFYAWQAHQLARQTGREDVCALPYGINTVSLFAYVFLVMLPAKLTALNVLKLDERAACEMAWQAGLLACLMCGVIELVAAPFAEAIRKATPRAALLSTLAGIALTFIALGFFVRTFAYPLVGLLPLGVVLLVYFGRVKFRGGLPGGLIAVGLGIALAWLTGLVTWADSQKYETMFAEVGWHWPGLWIGELWSSVQQAHLLTYLSVILPMGIFNIIGSLQNIESAEAAGDHYPTAPSLAVNGLGSVAAGLCGSCFPTTIYIGHPGWKAMGARAGYSTLNALFFTVVCFTGVVGYLAWLVPVEAGMAIVLWIGLVITAQAFQSTPASHAPAVVIGLLPSVAAWGVLMTKTAVRVTGTDFFQVRDKLMPAFERADVWLGGAFALEQGFIFTSMILAAGTVALIERQFRVAAVWCLIAAGLSVTGLMHAYTWTPADTALSLPLLDGISAGLAGDSVKAQASFAVIPWSFVGGYLLLAGLFTVAPWITEPYGESSSALSGQQKSTSG